MALHVNKDDVPTVGYDTGGDGELESRLVYGEEMNMLYAKRPDGYHSKPHAHPAEQFNFVLEGEMWLFTPEEAALLEPGDFHRVPGLAVHWGKVTDGPCILVEGHSPPLIGDEELVGEDREHVVGLFGEHEDPDIEETSRSVFASEDYADDEDRLMREYHERHG